MFVFAFPVEKHLDKHMFDAYNPNRAVGRQMGSV
jgi:hypothetical protein